LVPLPLKPVVDAAAAVDEAVVAVLPLQRVDAAAVVAAQPLLQQADNVAPQLLHRFRPFLRRTHPQIPLPTRARQPLLPAVAARPQVVDSAVVAVAVQPQQAARLPEPEAVARRPHLPVRQFR
jgi:hypothetical protein